jgi:hypothetical protein
MPLPSDADLAKLDIAYLGQPFVNVAAKPLNTQSLDIAYQAQPFVTGESSGGPLLNVWVKVGGAWKAATALYVKAGGVWKSVTDVSVKVAGVWKT